MAKAESRLDAHTERLADHEVDIRAFAPMTASHAVLTEQILQLQGTTGTILRRLDAQDAAREADKKEREVRQAEVSRRDSERQEQAIKDSQSWRRALILGSFTVLAAIIAAVGTIIASGL